MLILTMIFLHIIDDFVLQNIGNLSLFKQKKWWLEQKEYKQLYKYDYIVALAIHSFSWAFMIMLPIAIRLGFTLSSTFVLFFFANMIIHGVVDTVKANFGKINLVTDQILHLVQISITALYFYKSF